MNMYKIRNIFIYRTILPADFGYKTLSLNQRIFETIFS